MEPWKLVLDEQIFHFFASSRSSERRKLLKSFEELRGNPQREADYFTADATGRKLSVWAERPFLITFWLDAFVSEVRIVNVQRVRL